MMIKRLLIATVAALTLFGCKSIREIYKPKDTYAHRMFYEKYLNAGDPLDARIQQTLNNVRLNPKSASLHNELGQLLRAKGFPKDAEAEFERAVNAVDIDALCDLAADFADANLPWCREKSRENKKRGVHR